MIQWIRSFKWSVQCYNFFRKDALSHNIPLYKKYGIPKQYYSSVSSEDFKHLDNPKLKYDTLDSAQELPKEDGFSQLDTATQDALLPWSKNGYAVLEGFFSHDEVDTYNQEIQNLLARKQVQWGYGQKIMFAFRKSKPLYQAATPPKLMTILSLLMGKEMQLFQSINFLKGSQQRAHSDFIHMTTFPKNNLIAAWGALEDITEDSGPLHYYPGSHTLPYVLNPHFDNVGTFFRNGKGTYSDYEDRVQETIDEHALVKNVFLAKKGDVFIWHANLLHGGEPMINPQASRKSMVFHYFSKDAICYHEISQRPALMPRFSFD